MTVIDRALPAVSLLQTYAANPAAYTDCLSRDVARPVDLAEFVKAFYQTRLFRVERLILRVALRRASTDGEAADMAAGHTASFAAWTVEARNGQQLLLCDRSGHTRSWFMVAPHGTGTRLYFGSAVVNKDSLVMRVLLPFHQWYARALLKAVRV